MSLTESSTDGAAFSRSTGLPASMGKATAELRCRVPERVKDEFLFLAHSLGLSESDLLRSMVMVRLYGIETTVRMHNDQLRMAAGMPHESAAKGVAG